MKLKSIEFSSNSLKKKSKKSKSTRHIKYYPPLYDIYNLTRGFPMCSATTKKELTIIFHFYLLFYLTMLNSEESEKILKNITELL